MESTADNLHLSNHGRDEKVEKNALIPESNDEDPYLFNIQCVKTEVLMEQDEDHDSANNDHDQMEIPLSMDKIEPKLECFTYNPPPDYLQIQCPQFEIISKIKSENREEDESRLPSLPTYSDDEDNESTSAKSDSADEDWISEEHSSSPNSKKRKHTEKISSCSTISKKTELTKKSKNSQEQNVSNGLTSLPCYICSSKFLIRSTFEAHMRNHHKISVEEVEEYITKLASQHAKEQSKCHPHPDDNTPLYRVPAEETPTPEQIAKVQTAFQNVISHLVSNANIIKKQSVTTKQMPTIIPQFQQPLTKPQNSHDGKCTNAVKPSKNKKNSRRLAGISKSARMTIPFRDNNSVSKKDVIVEQVPKNSSLAPPPLEVYPECDAVVASTPENILNCHTISEDGSARNKISQEKTVLGIKNCDMVQEIKCHTNPDNKKPFECSFCGALCSKRSALTRHVRLHTHKRAFKCPKLNCDMTFKQKSHLTRHLKRVAHGINGYGPAKKKPKSKSKGGFPKTTTISSPTPTRSREQIQPNLSPPNSKQKNASLWLMCNQCKSCLNSETLIIEHIRRYHGPPSQSGVNSPTKEKRLEFDPSVFLDSWCTKQQLKKCNIKITKLTDKDLLKQKQQKLKTTFTNLFKTSMSSSSPSPSPACNVPAPDAPSPMCNMPSPSQTCSGPAPSPSPTCNVPSPPPYLTPIQRQNLISCDTCKELFTNYNVYMRHKKMHATHLKDTSKGIQETKDQIPPLEENVGIKNFSFETVASKLVKGKTKDKKMISHTHTPSRKATRNSLVCPHCDKTFCRYIQFQAHLKVHRVMQTSNDSMLPILPMKYSSSDNEEYTEQDNLSSPMSIQQPTLSSTNAESPVEETKLPCLMCSQTFQTSNQVIDHYQIHKNSVSFNFYN